MTGDQAFEQRFGFRAKGEFRCSFPFETVFSGIAAGFLVLGELTFLLNYTELAFRTNNMLAPLAIMVVWGFFWLWIVRISFTGMTCRYEADDKEFRINAPFNRNEVFYYADVESVSYKPIKYLTGRVRGYSVTIKSRYRAYNYKYIFSKNKLKTAPDDFPFHMIEEHAGLTGASEGSVHGRT